MFWRRCGRKCRFLGHKAPSVAFVVRGCYVVLRSHSATTRGTLASGTRGAKITKGHNELRSVRLTHATQARIGDRVLSDGCPHQGRHCRLNRVDPLR